MREKMLLKLGIFFRDLDIAISSKNLYFAYMSTITFFFLISEELVQYNTFLLVDCTTNPTEAG